MKTLLTLLLAVVFLTAGCAKEKKVADSKPVGNGGSTIIPPFSDDTSNGGFSSGSTASFTITNLSKFKDIFFRKPVYNPTNLRLNVNLAQVGSGWGGEVTLIFKNGDGEERYALVSTKHPVTFVEHADYNVWFTKDNKDVFHGFFQDSYGAFVVVIDDYDGPDLGDGQVLNSYRGSIWYQAFNRDYPNNPEQGPLKTCWQIELGPYDCRTFLRGDSVDTTSSLYPNNSGADRPAYVKVGTFSGLDRRKAFNE